MSKISMIQQFSKHFSRWLAIACLSLALLFGNLGLITPNAWAVDYNKRSLLNEDFSSQDRTMDSFDLASLRGTNFSNAKLQNVRFFGANLEYVNFEGADLRGAVLDSAKLNHASLKNANLEGAFLASARFNQTDIEGADFTDALLLANTNKLLCSIASGTNPATGRNTRDTLYCPD